MDKGYDFEEIYELIRDTLNSVHLSRSEPENVNGSPGITEEELLCHLIKSNIIKEIRLKRLFLS
jgi:hypothetical protein